MGTHIGVLFILSLGIGLLKGSNISVNGGYNLELKMKYSSE